MIKEWIEIKALVCKILYEEFKVPWYELNNESSELLSESYIGYDKAVKSFDPSKNIKFTTWCAFIIRCHLKDYLKYNNSLIHIPVNKKETEFIETKSIDAKYGDSDFILSDTLTSDYETDSDTLINEELSIVLSIINQLEHTLSGKELTALQFIKYGIIDDDDKVKYDEHRQYLYNVRKLIKEKLNNLHNKKV